MPLVEPTDDRKPTVSAAIMADCDEATFIPENANKEVQYHLWGQDRLALAKCGSLNAAKGVTIKALRGNAK